MPRKGKGKKGSKGMKGLNFNDDEEEEEEEEEEEDYEDEEDEDEFQANPPPVGSSSNPVYVGDEEESYDEDEYEDEDEDDDDVLLVTPSGKRSSVSVPLINPNNSNNNNNNNSNTSNNHNHSNNITNANRIPQNDEYDDDDEEEYEDEYDDEEDLEEEEEEDYDDEEDEDEEEEDDDGHQDEIQYYMSPTNQFHQNAPQFTTNTDRSSSLQTPGGPDSRSGNQAFLISPQSNTFITPFTKRKRTEMEETAQGNSKKFIQDSDQYDNDFLQETAVASEYAIQDFPPNTTGNLVENTANKSKSVDDFKFSEAEEQASNILINIHTYIRA